MGYIVVAGSMILHKSPTRAGAEKWFRQFAPEQSPELIAKLPEKKWAIKEVKNNFTK